MRALFAPLLSLLWAGSIHAQTLVPLGAHPQDLAWPTVTWPEGKLNLDVDQQALNDAVAELFSAKKDNRTPDTRALLIVQGGEIIFEQYAKGFDKDTRFHSWSAAKSFTNALIGVLINQGQLELDQPAPVPAWKGDDRNQITIRHMLNMTSGIDNSDAADDGFIGNALYGTGALDINEMAANRTLISKPGSKWAYSTATSNLLAYIAGNLTGDNRYERQEFVKEHLLSPIGIDDAVMTYDQAGYFLGGSHVYANARDYARLGYLYLRNGVWDGTRILPEGWVDFTRTPAPAENNGNHSAHFWLNIKGKGWQPNMLPGGPESAFVISGNGGQYVFILPSLDMLVVRLGEKQIQTWDELSTSIAKVVAVFPETHSTQRGGAQ